MKYLWILFLFVFLPFVHSQDQDSEGLQAQCFTSNGGHNFCVGKTYLIHDEKTQKFFEGKILSINKNQELASVEQTQGSGQQETIKFANIGLLSECIQEVCVGDPISFSKDIKKEEESLESGIVLAIFPSRWDQKFLVKNNSIETLIEIESRYYFIYKKDRCNEIYGICTGDQVLYQKTNCSAYSKKNLCKNEVIQVAAFNNEKKWFVAYLNSKSGEINKRIYLVKNAGIQKGCLTENVCVGDKIMVLHELSEAFLSPVWSTVTAVSVEKDAIFSDSETRNGIVGDRYQTDKILLTKKGFCSPDGFCIGDSFYFYLPEGIHQKVTLESIALTSRQVGLSYVNSNNELALAGGRLENLYKINSGNCIDGICVGDTVFARDRKKIYGEKTVIGVNFYNNQILVKVDTDNDISKPFFSSELIKVKE